MTKLFVIIFLLMFVVFPSSALALGQMSAPINIANAVRGQKINQEIIAINNEEKKIAVEFTASGQIKDWTKFYKPADLNNQLATTTIAGRNNLSLIAVIAIPKDIPNGEYKGVISVSKLPDLYVPKDQSSVSVTQKIDRQVTIKISDQEVIKLAISVIPETYDLAINQPLNVRIIYDNQSNISLSPAISFKIKKGEQTVYDVIYPYPEGAAPVNSNGYFEIPALSIPTAGLAQGKYLVQLQFLRADKVISEKQFNFSLGLYGGVSGILKDINLTALGNDYKKIILALSAALLLAAGLIIFKKKITNSNQNLEEDAE